MPRSVGVSIEGNHLQSRIWTVVWTFDPTATYEATWIRHCLSMLATAEEVDLERVRPHGRAIVVLSDMGKHEDRSRRLAAYVARCADIEAPVGVVHTSDEFYRVPQSIYQQASFVIRIGYWSPDLPTHVLAVPLGPSDGFMHASEGEGESFGRGADQREFVWSFMGQIHPKPTRRAMFWAFIPVSGGYIHATRRFNDPNGIRGLAYRRILANSTFALCPRGWSVDALCSADTFRAYEAAAAGAIPLVDSSYYAKAFGAPFPIVKSDWSDGPRLVRSLRSNPPDLAGLQERCRAWWRKTWDGMPLLVARHVHEQMMET